MPTHKKPNSTNNIVSFPATTEDQPSAHEVTSSSTSVNQKLSQADALKKANKAFHNAKARCKGGGGIRFLYSSFAEFLADVPLPKRRDVSLDRIIATGNYEPGNVRWVNKSVQSANKVTSRYGSKLTLHQIAQTVSAQQAKEQLRSRLATSWLNTCQMLEAKVRHDQCSVESQALPFLERSAGGALMPSRAGNLCLFPASYQLPSLQLLNETILVYARPGWCLAREYDEARRALRIDAGRGTIFASQPDFTINIHQNDGAALLSETRQNTKHGAVWFTRKAQGSTGLTSLETTLVSFGWQSALNGRDVAVLPAMRALEAIEQCQRDEGLLLAGAVGASRLIIPDFTIESEVGQSTASDRLRRLVRLVQERASRGLKTWVGVADPDWLHASIARDLLRILSLSEATPGSPLPGGMPQQLMTDESVIAEWWHRQARENVDSARLEYD